MGRASWTTRRAALSENGLPRNPGRAPAAAANGVFRHWYSTSSKSTTRRCGSMSVAWNFGAAPVFTVTVVSPLPELTATSVRRIGVSAPAPATEINITTASPARALGMLISRRFVICSLWEFEHHPVVLDAGLRRDVEHHHVGADL